MPFYVIVKLDNTSFYAYFYTKDKNKSVSFIIFIEEIEFDIV